jgi:hypothetical protein
MGIGEILRHFQCPWGPIAVIIALFVTYGGVILPTLTFMTCRLLIALADATAHLCLCWWYDAEQ